MAIVQLRRTCSQPSNIFSFNRKLQNFLPSFLGGISLVLVKTSDITGQRSAYETNTGPRALRTKEEGTRARKGHFLASSIAEEPLKRPEIQLREIDEK